jgi:serine-type D-Ala-D-Ala carboxypeptidase/endopeptidase (penicillin-binding protein 4)
MLYSTHRRHFRVLTLPIVHCLLLIFLFSCSVQKQIAKSANENVLNAPSLQTAHVGISIYEPETNKYWYNYQGDKYFVPASNTKIPTCYAAMKYLGDSLVGLKYGIPEEDKSQKRIFAIKPTGDPSFLHADYKYQPVFDFLKNKIHYGKLRCAVFFDTLEISNTEGLGNGWAWNDYEESYMAEHNRFPVFGNLINVSLKDTGKRVWVNPNFQWEKKYSFFETGSHFFDSIINKASVGLIEMYAKKENPFIEIKRNFSSNNFYSRLSDRSFKEQVIPFVTNGVQTTIDFLTDTLKGTFEAVNPMREENTYFYDCAGCDAAYLHIKNWIPVYSQPTDSLLKPMMHRSDNFFAEQSLLMVSNEQLGVMNDEKIIDTLLKTDFKDLPQKPRWVDGSGLSRYNLFTPQDFVAILNKMKNEFGMERIKVILPTGGEGTISNYYKTESGYIFAKTGTLGGVVAISGFLYTRKNKLLIFSILVNNHQSSATDVRRAVEKFLQQLRNNH